MKSQWTFNKDIMAKLLLDGQIICNDGIQPFIWDINLDVAKFSYLADHAFQGIIALPGSFYVELALAVANLAYEKTPYALENVVFQNVCVLPEVGVGSVSLTLSLSVNEEPLFQCVSRAGHKGLSSSSEVLHASAIISKFQTGDPHEVLVDTNLEAIQARCAEEITGEDFYAGLRTNGNQYGPAFQAIERLWRGANEVIAKIKIPETHEAEIGSYYLHPILLDACTQALAIADSKAPGHTFVLVGVDKIRINSPLSNLRWSYVSLTKDTNNSTNNLVGNVWALDETGQVLAELRGCRLQYFDSSGRELAYKDKPKHTIAIAATFTGEPLEEPLEFWKHELDLASNIEFSPYNQVFQQLLDPSSLLSSNKSGLNIVLIRFEDWVRHRNLLSSQTNVAEKEKLFQNYARLVLPNQLEIVHLNHYETEYMYQEIFVDQCYLKHGITLTDNACVIDIGANIGLFTLFVEQHCKNPTIYAFEPSPPVYELLYANTTLYGSNIQTFNCGLSNETKLAEFTFYENSSVFSSFNADMEQDKQAIRAVVGNMLKQVDSGNTRTLDSDVDEFMMGRLNSKSFVCPLKTLSDVVTENQIQQIDLLKIDAEKSELDILKGIEVDDWIKIKQIVMEVHDREGDLIKEIMDLLQEKGFQLALEEEDLLQGSGLYTLFAVRPMNNETLIEQDVSGAQECENIRENVHNLVIALKSAIKRTSTPYLLCICPASPSVVANSDLVVFYNQMEAILETELKTVQNLHLIRSRELAQTYPVSDYYDPYEDQLGHIPYTPAFFTALGSMIARKFHVMHLTPYKVIVLDCDQTLWKGICGEDGALGVEIDPPRKKLQAFMLGQLEAGMLICLCSKNSESDVLDVFEQNSDMILKRDHIVSWRINWKPKSENIKSLANELQLGLNSFIFIDDNPIECAEVQANCPEVLTLQLPEEALLIPQFLNHVWAFDHLHVTEEDKKRTTLYQQNIEREHFRKESLTLKDFLAGLELKVQISKAEQSNLGRVAQLTQRTNQFNFTTIRRTESQIKNFSQSGNLECLVIDVSDRFGDYGLVGTVLFQTHSKTIKVDTFLLSCRVLGRGVEYQMIAKLGQIAMERDLNYVDVPFYFSEKNQPALDFLTEIGSNYKTIAREGLLFRFPSEYLKTVDYALRIGNAEHSDEIPDKALPNPQSTRKQANYTQREQERLADIAIHLSTVDQILKKIETGRYQQHRPDLPEEYVAPSNELERSIAQIWQEVLGLEKVGSHDSFFEIGGTSLKGVQLIAKLKRELDIDLSIVNLYEAPTIATMATMLRQENGKIMDDEKMQASRRRGERRRARKKVFSRK